MITQLFRHSARIRGPLLAFFALTCALFITFGCGEEFPDRPTNPARQPSSDCSPACTGSLYCYEDDTPCDTPPCASCFPRTCPPENPVQSCVEGAICLNGQCTYEQVCNPGCNNGTHCVSGNCVIDYTPTNGCDPLDHCRSACGANNAGCIAACENDRSPNCITKLQTLQRCEAREGCSGSPTCCKDDFCAAFPKASGCSGRACDVCYNQCTTNGNVSTSCFNQCANLSAPCSTCLAPFTSDPACKTTPTPEYCEALFNQCVTL